MGTEGTSRIFLVDFAFQRDLFHLFLGLISALQTVAAASGARSRSENAHTVHLWGRGRTVGRERDRRWNESAQRIDSTSWNQYVSGPMNRPPEWGRSKGAVTMKVRNSLKSAKVREKNCVVVRRKGRVFVINKRNPKFKARQG